MGVCRYGGGGGGGGDASVDASVRLFGLVFGLGFGPALNWLLCPHEHLDINRPRASVLFENLFLWLGGGGGGFWE